jgi:neutral ceramidase
LVSPGSSYFGSFTLAFDRCKYSVDQLSNDIRAMNYFCRTGLAAFLFFAGLVPISAEGLRAGIARADITPDKPVTLAGYASRINFSQGVHDPLSARAVAFEQGGKRLVLMSVDVCGFYNDTAEPLRQAIIDRCQLQPAELFLCATHTHSGPALGLDPAKARSNNVEYTRSLQSKLADLGRQALDRLAPVQVGVGSGASPVGANRREVTRDNTGTTRIILGRNPSVLTDREVQVLKLTTPERNELAGAVFAYATHSTSLGPRNYMISGDIHGLAAQFVEKYLAIVTPVFAGASGNIDPWYRVLPGFNATKGWIPEPILLGTLLGEEVVHVLNGIQKPATNVTIKTAIKTTNLQGKSRGEIEGPSAELTAPFVITVAAIGDIAFVGLGGEVFTEIGQTIKKASPFPHTFVFTHCNGAAGYLPTRASYPEGGYEVQSSSFAPGADEQLAADVRRMLVELR